MAKKTREEAVAGKVLVIQGRGNKQRRVVVPADATVTFGPTVPFERKSGDDDWSLRVYADVGKKKLLAVFAGVAGFHELGTIKISERRVKSKRHVMEKDSKDFSKGTVMEARVEEWVDPDDDEDAASPKALEFFDSDDE